MNDVGSAASFDALSRERVAELIVTHAQGRLRASGYRVTTESVLTAAHVVEGAESVRVRFEPDLLGEWATSAVSWWADPGSDVAVVSIASRPGEGPLSPTRFGRISDLDAVLAVRAVGFPRWKMRNYDGTIPIPGDGKERFRDAEHVVGSVAVLSNWREGTLEVVVPAAPVRDPASAASAWEGMSGAALWAGDRIVGVVAKHHPGDGLARLAASRVDVALDGLDHARKGALRELLPLLPERSGQLPDVLPARPEQLTLSAYQAQLADIAPDQLYDRDMELCELVGFCAGDQPYAWWQAGPWAGKSALLSWFALQPPAGVDVVSFFITSRFAGQSDSDAFTGAMLEQLAALTGELLQTSMESRARPGHTLRLLQAAAQRSQEAGRRLLLIIDGLDEDTSTAAGIDRASIASLLPRSPPPEVRVLVASRLDLNLPEDVPGDHPLRRIPPRLLAKSAHARDVERTAKVELTRLLKGSPFQRDVLGLITASGGGVTQPELAELTGQPPYELDGLLGGPFGRSIGGRVSPTPVVGRPAERAYLFTHETLRETAEQQYGTSLTGYRDRLHAWAEGYRDRGWPADTPTYLLRGYPRMLATVGDIPRLLDCATDRPRHDRMLDLTGGDALAFTEITTITNLITEQSTPDLGALLLLAVARDDLAERNTNIPAELPAVWITISNPARASALANGITDSRIRARSLTLMVTAAFNTGDQDRTQRLATAAEQLAGQIPDPGARAEALTQLVGVVAATGDHDRAHRLATVAEQLARGINDPAVRAGALAQAAEAVAATGDQVRAQRLATVAEQLARELVDPWFMAQALTHVVVVVAATGDHDAAEQLAREITDPGPRAEALARLAGVVAAAGDHTAAERLATAAEQLAREITDPGPRAEALIQLVGLVDVTGDRAAAERLATAAEQFALKITHPWARAEALTQLVRTVAAAGDHDTAERLAGKITNPETRAEALAQVAGSVAATGDHDTAERLARKITNPWARDRALTQLAGSVAAAGDHVTVERLAREITEPWARAEALAQLAESVAATGDHVTVERLAREITDPRLRAEALTRLAESVAAAGDHDAAEQLALEITDPWSRAEALALLIGLAAAAGDHDRAQRLATAAERLAQEITDPWPRAEALIRLIGVVAAADYHDRAQSLATAAERLAQEITDPRSRAETLTRLVEAVARGGDHDTAERLAQEITDPWLRAEALALLADTLICLSGSGPLADRRRHERVLLVRRVLAEVIGTPSWRIALPLVARLDGAALQSFCHVIATRSAVDLNR